MPNDIDEGQRVVYGTIGVFSIIAIVVVLCMWLCGCGTLATIYKPNPLYLEYLKQGKEPPETVKEWLPDERMETRGMGKIEADFEKDKIKREVDIFPQFDLKLDKMFDD